MRKFLLLGLLLSVIAVSMFSAAPVNAQGRSYIVQPGDTLFSIAARFNVSASELATINGIYDVNLVYAGQALVLPDPLPYNPPPAYYPQPPQNYPPQQPPVYTPVIVTYPPGTTVTTTTNYKSYTVRPGDTLSGIAQMFNTSPHDIMAANGISNPNLVYCGQVLVIPRTTTRVSPAPQPVVRPRYGRLYIVQPGDNLFGIAARFRRDVYAIAKANGILDLNAIYVGQALAIP